MRFGQEIVEVATFRAAHTEIDEDHGVDEAGHRVLDEHGRILRDNLYGTIEEDVWRRDFTANALYYNIEDYSIWDYVGGVPDARDRVLRMIGDPGDTLPRGPGAHAARRPLCRRSSTSRCIRTARRRSTVSRTCSTACRRRGCSTRS